jgi:PAS domain S-box-containing protein
LVATVVASLSVLVIPTLTVVTPSVTINTRFPVAVSVLVVGTLISILHESLHRAHQQAEQNAKELSETNKRLSESNERFHLLVQSVKDYGIFALDPQGNIISWNTGAENITGYKAEEIIGQHFARLCLPEDTESGKLERELQEATATGRYEEEGWRVRKDGSRFWAHVIITAIRDESGQLHGFSKVTHDMTERKRAEESYRLLIQEQVARAEAEASSQAKDEFLAILSHELRTPLTAILGWSDLLRSGKLDRDTTAMAAESIERSAKAQAVLVEDLIDVSRMISDKFSIDPILTELAPVIETAVNSLRPSAAAKDIQLHIDSDPVVGAVLGDPVRLGQVMLNLISNAIKFTPNGGSVTVRLEEVAAGPRIKISDTGQGIDPAVLPIIFDHFRQADSSSTRGHGGLGLGLAIVRYVVEAHGGVVTAESPGTGQGATFTVQLPWPNSQLKLAK